MSCVVYDDSTNNGADTTSWFTNGNPPAALSSSMITNTRDGDVVTSVLTIESVSLNDNGNGYFCSPSFGVGSDVGVISVAGEYEWLNSYSRYARSYVHKFYDICIYIHTYIHTYIYIYMYIYVCMYVIHSYVHTVYVMIFVCIHSCHHLSRICQAVNNYNTTIIVHDLSSHPYSDAVGT